MSARVQTWLWLAQRASAAVLALAVLVHLGTLLYAVRGGLSAAEILARVQGHAGWAWFYGVFLAAAVIHGPLGVRTVLAETTALPAVARDALTVLFGVALAVLGARALAGVLGHGGP